MNVLSLFDGISCARLAISDFPITGYYASEIDEWAISISNYNFKDIVQIGDVKCVNWYLPNIDLLIGGSPCQNLSIAGDGKGLEGKDSKLIYEFLRIKSIIKPKYFILENVNGKFKNAMDCLIGCEGKIIEASNFVPQKRTRVFWTNISFDENMPKIDTSFKDILEQKFDDKYLLSKNEIKYMNRKVKGGRNHWDFKHHHNSNEKTSRCVVSNFYKGVPYNVLVDGNIIRKLTPIECERLMGLPDNYTKYGFTNKLIEISNTQRYRLIGNAFVPEIIKHIIKGIKK